MRKIYEQKALSSGVCRLLTLRAKLKGSEASRSRRGSSWGGKLQNTTPKWAKSCGRLEQRIR